MVYDNIGLKGGVIMAKTSEAQIKAVRKYNDAKTTQIKLCLNNEHDADIIDRINSMGVGNKQTYIKKLIRDDIAKNA